MRAFVVDKYRKDGLRAADVPEPLVGRRDVLVRVSAASINPLDTMTRNGGFKQLIKRKPPFVLGHDLAGVVTDVGADVRDLNVGAEVYARPRDLRIGAYAESIAIDQDDVAPKPNALTLQGRTHLPHVGRGRMPRSVADSGGVRGLAGLRRVGVAVRRLVLPASTCAPTSTTYTAAARS